MMDILTRGDPAEDLVIDSERLRQKVDERLGVSVHLAPAADKSIRPWMRAAAAFAVAISVIVPVALLDRSDQPSELPFLALPGDLSGGTTTIGLDGGGVKTAAVDGDTIWVMNALQNRLDRIDAATHEVEVQYTIEAYVEGVTVGGGFVWLSSYERGGELIRFHPGTGRVDLTIPTEGAPVSVWFGDHLWMSDGDGIRQLSAEGEVVSTRSGQIKGTGLGFLWLYEPVSRSIIALGEDGVPTDIAIPPDTPALGDHLSEIREIVATRQHVWLVEGGAGELGSSVTRYDPGTGELQPLTLVPGLLGAAEYEGSLWVTSHTEHLLVRVDPISGETETYALPGRPGAVFEADGSIWVGLNQPGALARLDPGQLLSTGERVIDMTLDGTRLVCTAATSPDSPPAPTVILDANSWIGHGSWSMVQAELSHRGVTSCAFGYVGEPMPPEAKAADMEAILDAAQVEGPYVVAAAMDGVHSTRLFADRRDDIVGVVLVDPMPIGFQAFYDESLPGWGHPAWADIDPDVSAGLAGFADVPLVVVEQDPQSVFLHPRFLEAAGVDAPNAVNDYYQAGLDFYAALSTESTTVTSTGSGLDMTLWVAPDLVAEQVVDVIARGGGR